MSNGERWAHMLLADDWVRCRVLPHWAGVAANQVRLHSGELFRSVLEHTPGIEEVLGARGDNRREPWVTKLLRALLESHFVGIMGSTPHADIWRFLYKYLGFLELPYRVVFFEKKELGLVTTRGIEEGVTRLWGDLVLIDDSICQLLRNGGSFSPDTLVRGTSSRGKESKELHVLFGPLSLINYACGTHALLRPDVWGEGAPAKGEGRSWPSYLSTSDWRSAYLLRDVEEGVEVTIDYFGQEEGKKGNQVGELRCGRCYGGEVSNEEGPREAPRTSGTVVVGSSKLGRRVHSVGEGSGEGGGSVKPAPPMVRGRAGSAGDVLLLGEDTQLEEKVDGVWGPVSATLDLTGGGLTATLASAGDETAQSARSAPTELREEDRESEAGASPKEEKRGEIHSPRDDLGMEGSGRLGPTGGDVTQEGSGIEGIDAPQEVSEEDRESESGDSAPMEEQSVDFHSLGEDLGMEGEWAGDNMGWAPNTVSFRLGALQLGGAQKNREGRAETFKSIVVAICALDIDVAFVSELGASEEEVSEWKSYLRGSDCRFMAAVGTEGGDCRGVGIMVRGAIPITGIWADEKVREEDSYGGGRCIHLVLGGRGRRRVHCIGFYSPAKAAKEERERLNRVVGGRCKIAREGGESGFESGPFFCGGDANSVVEEADRGGGALLDYDRYGLAKCLSSRGRLGCRAKDGFRLRFPGKRGIWTRDVSQGHESRIDSIWLGNGAENSNTVRCGIGAGAAAWTASDHKVVVLELGFGRLFDRGKFNCLATPSWGKLRAKCEDHSFIDRWERAVEEREGEIAAWTRELLQLPNGPPASWQAFRATVNAAGAAFILITEATLQEAWGKTPPKGEGGHSLEDCGLRKSLRCVKKWTKERAREGGRLLRWEGACRTRAEESGYIPEDGFVEGWIERWESFLVGRLRKRDELRRRDKFDKTSTFFREAMADNRKGLKKFSKRVLGIFNPKLDLLEAIKADGETTGDPGEVDEVVAQHFEDIWAPGKPPPPEVQVGVRAGRPCYHIGKCGGWVEKVYTRRGGGIDAGKVLRQPSKDEWREWLGLGKSESTPGESGISYDMLAKLPDSLFELYWRLSCICLGRQIIPRAWKDGVIFPIPKASGVLSVSNCRPICLLEHAFKAISGWVCRELKWALEEAGVLDDEQFGFRPRRGAGLAIAGIMSAIDWARRRGRGVWLLFLDCEKAFDSVPHWALEISYRRLGLEDPIVDFLSEMDFEAESSVLHTGRKTRKFTVGRGVRQGDVLSPLKFIAWMDGWLQLRRAIGGGIATGAGPLNGVAYADDLTEITVSRAKMAERIDMVGKFLAWSGMGVNASKSHVMVAGRVGQREDPFIITSWDAQANRTREGKVFDVGDEAVKVLGAHIDRCLSGNKLVEVLDAGLTKFCEAVKRRAKNLEEGQVMSREILGAKLAYYLPFTTISDAKLASWDQKIRGAVKRKAGVVRSVSNSALYSSWAHGGVQLYNAEAECLAAQCAEWAFFLNTQGPIGELTRRFFSKNCGEGIGEGHHRPQLEFWGTIHDRLVRAGGALATWDRGWATRGRFGDKRVAEIAPYARWARRRKIVWFGDLVENGVLMSLSRVRDRFPAVGNTEWDSRREQEWYDAVERYWSTEMGGKLGEQVGIGWKRPRDGREGGLGLEGHGGIVWAFGDGSKDPSKAGSPVGWGVRVYKNDGWGTGDILWEEAGGLESIGGREKSNNFAEARALLWAMENCAREATLLFWTDSQVVRDRWKKLKRMGTRSWVSISDGGVWRAIEELRRERLAAGGDTDVCKCFSHVGERVDGNGRDQPYWVTKGNEAADFLANRGREGARGVREDAIRGFGVYGMFDCSGPIDGNVRMWARNQFWEGEKQRWALQPSQGKYVGAETDPVAMEGMVEPTGAGHGRGGGGLALKLRADVLPVPTNLVKRDGGAEEKGVWKWREGGVECPLCKEGVGSAEHALAECVSSREARDAGLRELDELLWGWGDIVEGGDQGEQVALERGAQRGKLAVGEARWADWVGWGRAKGFSSAGEVADWVWGLEGHTIAPAWPTVCREWLGVGPMGARYGLGPKKPPLKVGVMLGKSTNRVGLAGHFSLELDALAAGRAARDTLRMHNKVPCRVVSWVWTKTREEGKTALRRWGDNSQGMGRVVLSVPMERFPLFKWRRWLRGNRDRRTGPVIGQMKLIIWENQRARRYFPVGDGFFSAVGQAARDSVFGGLLGLRVKQRTEWTPLAEFVGDRPHPENWLRAPPPELEGGVWLGFVPRDLRKRMSQGGPTPTKGDRRRMGRATLGIVKEVWSAYAGKLAEWKVEVGLVPPAEERKAQKKEQSVRKKARENKERVRMVCMGELCVAARGSNRPSRRVRHFADRKCAVCRRRERKLGKGEGDKYRIGDMARRFADAEDWALAYKEFRQRFFVAFGKGGEWREEEWGKRELNVGASYAWRRYKEQGKSAAEVKANKAVGRRQKKRRRRGGNASLNRYYAYAEKRKVTIVSSFTDVGICGNCRWTSFGGSNTCDGCAVGKLRNPEERTDGKGRLWIEEWHRAEVYSSADLKRKRDQVSRCAMCNIIRPLGATGGCPICNTQPGTVEPSARGRWIAGKGEGDFRCSLCMRRGKGRGGSCPNKMCLGKLGVQTGRVRRGKTKRRERKVTLRSAGKSRRGLIRESSSGSSGSEFEPKEWDPQVARGGRIGQVKFTRKGQKATAKGEVAATTEVWLSLWDRGRLEGCAALHWGGNFWVGSGDGCEIRLNGRDIGKKHTGLRVDVEGSVWITDMGCRGGTRTKEGKLAPHSERRLCGNEFWCGRNSRHFQVSTEVPSERTTGVTMGVEERKGDAGSSKTTGSGGEGGEELGLGGLLERGEIDDFVITCDGGGRVHHHLLRDGSSCWLGEGEGPKIKWSGSGNWCFGRLKAEGGLLSLTTDRAALVSGLVAEGECSSSEPTTFQIQQARFRILGATFTCHRVCFSPNRVFFYGVSGIRMGGSSTVQRTDVGVSNKLGKRGVERGIT